MSVLASVFVLCFSWSLNSDHANIVPRWLGDSFINIHPFSQPRPEPAKRDINGVSDVPYRSHFLKEKCPQSFSCVANLLLVCAKPNIGFCVIPIHINPVYFESNFELVDEIIAEGGETFIFLIVRDSAPPVVLVVGATQVGTATFHSTPASPHSFHLWVSVFGRGTMSSDSFCSHLVAEAPAGEYTLSKIRFTDSLLVSARTLAKYIFDVWITSNDCQSPCRSSNPKFIYVESTPARVNVSANV